VSRRPAPPGGWPPPETASLAGEEVALVPLAEETSRRYFDRHPEDLARYGDVARDWEVHDTLHLLNWAVGDVEGHVDLGEQVAWLAGVLEARDFPLEHLASNLDIAADVTAGPMPAVSERLRAAAALVRGRETFLS
jgi:hypothetical protein